MYLFRFSQRKGEYIIGIEEGIDRARIKKRHIPDKRWDSDDIDKIKGVPLDIPGEQDANIKMASEFDDEAITIIESKQVPVLPLLSNVLK